MPFIQSEKLAKGNPKPMAERMDLPELAETLSKAHDVPQNIFDFD